MDFIGTPRVFLFLCSLAELLIGPHDIELLGDREENLAEPFGQVFPVSESRDYNVGTAIGVRRRFCGSQIP